ncbi:serine/threonine-protein kinase-like protein CCR4 isoform X2 [Macadamia integrifolia]|uniref:serine/threonine-protein kinase-like protein CCR4 isoform X2 n=1 Tax=Macadamia integrifolia TaxID=60698 RepID=UPI001C4FAF41|nr:serine/threonine-protein kinase-like protein CCR4 isoform X2 [Macadamia integrifolia]
MTPLNPFSLLLLVSFIFFVSTLPLSSSISSVAISETSNQIVICALVSQTYINCTSSSWGTQNPIPSPKASLSAITVGDGFVCFLRYPSPISVTSVGCYRFSGENVTNLAFKRIYRGPMLNDFQSGNSHVCGIVNGSDNLVCWQWHGFNPPNVQHFIDIAVGEEFVCGVLESGQVKCFGTNMDVVGKEPDGNYGSIVTGLKQACAISIDGTLVNCWGQRARTLTGKFYSVALGDNRGCALLPNDTISCWGDHKLPESLKGLSFFSITGQNRVFCGVLMHNNSLICWGGENFGYGVVIFPFVLPGPCQPNCQCGMLPDYGRFCSPGFCRREVCRVHDSGRLERTAETTTPQPGVPQINPEEQSGNHSFSFTPTQGSNLGQSPRLEKRLSQLVSMGSGKLEEFTLEELRKVTENFSDGHKVGSGSFGSVYRAILEDGRDVAIKRAELLASSSPLYAGSVKRQEDQDNAFLSEVANLSRLNHMNLVRLYGYCEEANERVLVYEFMVNGTLHDHLHSFMDSSPLQSWAARIKVALDSARGIEYLHTYAVPQIIHRDIKSSNILLDAYWIAKVSDFGLSMMGPEDDDEDAHISLRAAGTVGYMDPAYYKYQQLTLKSDVYSFGVVLLELLSGCKAIHRNEETGLPRNLVDYMVPYIARDEVHRVLDRKMTAPTPCEIEAVQYVGYIAADCVVPDGRDRPTMTEIVGSLERALAACLANPNFSRSTTGSIIEEV